MNWTGGRLRRQSHNRPDSKIRIQKQHFAKARLKQREAHQRKHLTSVLGHASASDLETLAESSYCTAESQQIARSSQPINPTNEFIERIRPKNNSQNESTSSNGLAFNNVNNVETNTHRSHIDLLKDYLLGKKDWVDLVPTRPLHMKFATIEEKEKIGKRRKICRGEEARSVMIKDTTNTTGKSAHLLHSRLDKSSSNWRLDIQIDSPKAMKRAYENSERPIRPVSLESMLSTTHEIDEGHGRLEENTFAKMGGLSQSTKQDQADQKYFAHDLNTEYPSDQLDRRLDYSPEREVSATLPDTETEMLSSPMPILHRFTLDDQVSAEKLANSQVEAGCSRSYGSDHYSDHLGRRYVGSRNTSDNNHKIFNLETTTRSDDRQTDIGDYHESDHTESDALPQTQKISKQLPPYQPRLPLESHTDRFPQSKRTESRNFEEILSSKGYSRESAMLFRQRVRSMSPEQLAMYTVSHPIATIQDQDPFDASKSHWYQHASPYARSTRTPLTVSKPMESNTLSKTSHPTLQFRFPSYWTPHRTTQQLTYDHSTNDEMDVLTSPLVSSLPQRSPFINVLSRGSQHSRQSTSAILTNISNVLEDPKIPVEHEEYITAPVFNTPFRR